MKNKEKSRQTGTRNGMSLSVLKTGEMSPISEFKDKGSLLVKEARNLATEAVDMLPQEAKDQIEKARREVVSKMKDSPTVTTVAAAAVAGIGAAFINNRLLRAYSANISANTGKSSALGKNQRN